MDITRRGFGGALGGITVSLWLGGCGDGGDDGDFVIGGNHANGAHEIFITTADLEKEIAVFNIAGQATHNHTVTFTKADFDKLKAGTRIDAISTLATDGTEHLHQVTVFAVAE